MRAALPYPAHPVRIQNCVMPWAGGAAVQPVIRTWPGTCVMAPDQPATPVRGPLTTGGGTPCPRALHRLTRARVMGRLPRWGSLHRTRSTRRVRAVAGLSCPSGQHMAARDRAWWVDERITGSLASAARHPADSGGLGRRGRVPDQIRDSDPSRSRPSPPLPARGHPAAGGRPGYPAGLRASQTVRLVRTVRSSREGKARARASRSAMSPALSLSSRPCRARQSVTMA